MASLVVTAGGPVALAKPENYRVIGFEVIADVDASEAPWTGDFTLTAEDKEVYFMILTAASAGTLTATLYTGTTHATEVTQKALVAQNAAPAASVALAMATAANRKAFFALSPNALTAANAVVGTLVSLKLTADGSFSDGSTVTVVVLSRVQSA